MSSSPHKPQPSADVFRRGAAILRDRATGAQAPVPLPWPSLADRLQGGLWPGVYFLTGAIASGKTQAALQIGLAASSLGTPVLFCAPEMGAAEVTARAHAVLHRTRWTPVGLGPERPDAEARTLDGHAEHPLEMLVEMSAAEELSIFDAAQDFLARHAAARALIIIEDSRLEARRLGNIARRLVQTGGASILAVETLRSDAGDPAEPLRHPLARTADAVFHLCAAEGSPMSTPAGSISVDLVLAKHRFGPTAQIALRFYGGWFDEDAHDLELELTDPSQPDF